MTPEEKALWDLVTRHADPLRVPQQDEEPEEIPTRKPVVRSYKSRRALPAAKNEMPELVPGTYAGVDGSTAEKFRRGDYPIDAELDLHGMSRDKAHRALEDFLHRQYGGGARCLLVITGKGTGKTTSGVLRESLPGWLTHPDLRPMVLAVDSARPKHGGTGAYYILLKRKR